MKQREAEEKNKREAKLLAGILKQKNRKIVFAESCTAGLVSASLAKVPGISEYLCGSAVVYRIETKRQWLGLNDHILKNNGAVNAEVAKAMVEKVLRKTPEADIAASITGYLGPSAPKAQDGRCFLAVASKKKRPITKEIFILPRSKKSRELRQVLASQAVLFMVRSLLTSRQI